LDYNIKIDDKVIWWSETDWTFLAQGKDPYLVFVRIVTKLRLSWLAECLLSLKDELVSWLETVSDSIKHECRPKCKTWWCNTLHISVLMWAFKCSNTFWKLKILADSYMLLIRRNTHTRT
jgi:hypothetical protein